jgi:hypothetical protein
MVWAGQKVDLDFSMTSKGRTIYLTVWAQGELPSKLLFVLSIQYKTPSMHSYVPWYSGQVIVNSARDKASTTVQATIPAGLSNVHFYVHVYVYNASNRALIASAAGDPKVGGGNGGAG